MIQRTSSLMLICWTLSGCGANFLASNEAKDPAEDAAIALERGDEDEAIKILEEALLDDSENPQFLSVLAAAYAQRAGIDPLSFAQGMAAQESGDGSGDAQSQGSLVSLFGIMPVATEQGLLDIDKAITLLASIPADERSAGDPFKFAIYQTASMVLHMKILDTDGDGQLSLEEITNLSDNSASGLLSQLAGAAAILGGESADSATMAKAAENIGNYQTQIDAAPGATQEEKLRNYMAQSQSTP